MTMHRASLKYLRELNGYSEAIGRNNDRNRVAAINRTEPLKRHFRRREF